MTNVYNMIDYTEPKVDENSCCDIYYEITQMLDEWWTLQNNLEDYYKSTIIYKPHLSDNPKDCMVSTLDERAESIILEIIDPSTEFIELFNTITIDHVYDSEDLELLKEMRYIIFNTIGEYRKLLNYYTSINF